MAHGRPTAASLALHTVIGVAAALAGLATSLGAVIFGYLTEIAVIDLTQGCPYVDTSVCEEGFPVVAIPGLIVSVVLTAGLWWISARQFRTILGTGRR